MLARRDVQFHMGTLRPERPEANSDVLLREEPDEEGDEDEGDDKKDDDVEEEEDNGYSE
jgi:hypothetical protein